MEGPTERVEVLALRRRQVRNLLATLFCSQGVVMLSHGDEIGRTQKGNNNAYCQDNEIAWIDWEGAGLAGEYPENDLLDYVRGLARLRSEHPVFRRRRFFRGSPVESGRAGSDGLPDISWLRPDGSTMEGPDWNDPERALGVFLNGDAITEPDTRGRPIRDDSFVLLLNNGPEPVEFKLPGTAYGMSWETVLDTADPDVVGRPPIPAGGPVRVIDRALILLRRTAHRRA